MHAIERRRNPPEMLLTGPPRSGTSLAMQMLRAGGIPLPTGDSGRALKVTYALVRHLPPAFETRVLWMRRHPGEGIPSQERMPARRA